MLYRRLPRFDFPHRCYFLTCCLEGRRPLLSDPRWAGRLLALYAQQQDKGRITIHAYVLMSDHYHCLLSLQAQTSISGLVRGVHACFAREYRSVNPTTGRIWQRRCYDHVIRDEADLLTKATYIHDNPVRAGLAADVGEYPWSSFGFWETGRGPVRCQPWR